MPQLLFNGSRLRCLCSAVFYNTCSYWRCLCMCLSFYSLFNVARKPRLRLIKCQATQSHFGVKIWKITAVEDNNFVAEAVNMRVSVNAHQVPICTEKKSRNWKDQQNSTNLHKSEPRYIVTNFRQEPIEQHLREESEKSTVRLLLLFPVFSLKSYRIFDKRQRRRTGGGGTVVP